MPLHAPIRPLRRLRGSVVAAACATLLGTVGSLPAAHAADRHPLVGSRPAYATRTADTGPVPAGSHVSARLYLNSRDPQGLAAFLRDISDPRSPHYRHYLTPADYQRHFGPTDRQIRTLTAWLVGSGFTVTARTSPREGVVGVGRVGGWLVGVLLGLLGCWVVGLVGSIEVPVPVVIFWSASACRSKVVRRLVVSWAEVRGRLSAKVLRVSM
ncbi:protease pro-enzyme activation domain-containing protein [Streptomyces sasae]|uniref:protease pro-enzyme activation domain-containing protein n=1 Tax=Streptomyces sasae TaxID=1266772 RepID=UPI0029317D10|nr:protease pro-enzyme activation domain-containing protein [Streptomyces sasae]